MEEPIIPKLSFGEWVEKNRIAIGAILLLGIIASGIFLLWRENFWKPKLEKRIEALELKVQEIENTKVSTNPPQSKSVDIDSLISASQGASDGSGKVAGASSLNNQETSNPSTSSGLNGNNQTKAPAAVSGAININSADAKGLDSLPGIGPVLSQRIIDYRNTNGPFSSVEQIKNVKGIGDALFGKIKDQISI